MGVKTEGRVIMGINIGGGELKELKPRILVLGVGGAGGNAINAMIESGIFSDIEIQNFIFDDFEEGYGYKKNPEKDPVYKPYKEKSRAERMADPDRGINSPAFKDFMKKQGM